jgi:hypothetical protein
MQLKLQLLPSPRVLPSTMLPPLRLPLEAPLPPIGRRQTRYQRQLQASPAWALPQRRL